MPKSEISFTRYFAELPDPRSDRTKKHALSDILGVTLCAVICGADSFEEVEWFGGSRLDWLRKFFPLRNGVRGRHHSLKVTNPWLHATFLEAALAHGYPPAPPAARRTEKQPSGESSHTHPRPSPPNLSDWSSLASHPFPGHGKPAAAWRVGISKIAPRRRALSARRRERP